MKKITEWLVSIGITLVIAGLFFGLIYLYGLLMTAHPYIALAIPVIILIGCLASVIRKLLYE